MRFAKYAALFGLVMIGFRCVKKPNPIPATYSRKAQSGDKESNGKADSVTSISGPNARELCKLPLSARNEPETIDDVVDLINALPKPVSAACLVDVLKRPLRLNATSNTFSGQPATSSEAPRIFLFSGKSLIISVVPAGQGAKVMEFGFRVDNTHSIKGELPVPVLETLPPGAAYNHILLESKNGTLCTGCHSGERKAEGNYPETVFISGVTKPREELAVSLSDLRVTAAACETEKKPECELLQAIFRGPVQAENFPN